MTLKLTSVPPRSGAQEPSMQLLAFHLDRADRLLEQTQRRAYGYTAPALRRGGSGKNFFTGRVSPSGGPMNTTTISLYIRLVYLKYSI